MISLIDRTNQYIVSEATRTLSLQSDSVHNDQDELWFGCTTLPRSQGLCENALEIIPSSKSQGLFPLIINDLSQDKEFKHCPFVKSRPSLRFYAATPIRTQSGFNIGTLSVMDDHPREGMSDIEVRFLGDMAATIMTHFETTRVKNEHRRSEKMVKGLGLFVEGRSALSEWRLDTENNQEGRQQIMKDGGRTHSSETGRPRSDLDLHSLTASKESVSANKTQSPDVIDYSDLPKIPSSPQPKPAGGTSAKAQSKTTVDLRPILAAQIESDNTSRASNSGNQETLSDPTPVSTKSPVPRIGEDQYPAGSNQSLRTSAADLQETMLSENLKEMFSRASNIIRECIEVDGTIFLDASIGTFGGYTSESHSRSGQLEFAGKSQESLMSSSEEERGKTPTPDAEPSEVDPADSDASHLLEKTSNERHDGKKKRCGILGLSTQENSSLEGDKPPETFVPLSEAFLQRLLQKYPRGHVFNLGERPPFIASTKHSHRTLADLIDGESGSSEKIRRRGKPSGGANQGEEKALLQMLPRARSVVFFPLWDSPRKRWFAGSFGWTTRSTRVLTRVEDLSYLAAFGNSIMAEVARLDTVAADRAKSDFISSISHELRSPLHGILASVEFLQDTAVDSFQNSMIDTIERCGKTLLDTIQHVLDFAKINNFTKSKRHEKNDDRSSSQGLGQNSRSKMASLSVDVDVSALIEDVMDAVYAGHGFQPNASLRRADESHGVHSEDLPSSTANESGTVVDQFSDQPILRPEPLTVIIDIGHRSNWTFNTQSGALRRVMMNLFGNALKYTDTGWVKISLQSKDVTTTSQSQQSDITITVSDSGRGITQEFLHGHLFTPFSQENYLNPGTGLGLSIVLQIVQSLGGTIEVQSELGIGTEVKVSLTLAQASIPPKPLLIDNYGDSILAVREKTSELKLRLVGFDDYSETRFGNSEVEPELSLSLQASLQSMAIDWFGMDVTTSQSLEVSPPDIYIVNELEPSLEPLVWVSANLK